MRTFYVEGTKKGANYNIALDRPVHGTEYKLGEKVTLDVTQLTEKAVIKFWLKRDPYGNPIAKSYGNWDPSKHRFI